jgi:ribosomal protein S18 acetylase RimI-like enzyme
MIYTATLSNIPEIQAISARVWPQSYKEVISSGQISYMLDLMYSSEALKKQMLDQGCEFLLYQPNDYSVGFASYSKNEEGIWRLHKLYVDIDQHGKGIGKILLEEVKKRVAAKGGNELELNVNKRNKSKDFYYSQGFTLRREEVIDIGEGYVMDDFVLVANISDF